MISKADDKKKQIRITEGNIRNSHIPVTGLRNILPSDCFGKPRKTKGLGRSIRLYLEGLNTTIETDIGTDAKTGKPRRQFRVRGWISKFFNHYGAKAGDILEFERVDERDYHLRFLNSITTGSEDNAIRVAEFFSGIGLVRLALEKFGCKVVFANDIDPDKLEIYRDNFASDEFVLGDIHLLKPEDIPDCDLATASFPCTDLSIAGAMNGIYSGESSAFWGLTRLLDEIGERRPPILLLENVPGFLMSHGGEDFKAALISLNDLGYVCDTFFMDAAFFVPQSRLRLFVVGRRGIAAESTFGVKTTLLRPKTLVDFITTHSEIKWNLQKLPAPPDRSVTLESIIEDLSDEHPAWWNKERADYFFGQLSERHAATAKKMIKSTTYSYGTAFRRIRNGRSMAELRTDGLAGCLRTPKGGSGRQILFKAGKGRYQVRLLTGASAPDCREFRIHFK